MKTAQPVRLLTATLLGLTLALPLAADEQRSKAPGRSEAGAGAQAKIDLNTADVKTLEATASIGPEAAKAIVAARPFASLDELDRVKGISAEQLEQIRAKTMVSTTAAKNKLGEPTREKKPLGAPESARYSATAKVDINTADVKTLEAIPSIGPELAASIVAARPFASLDDLSRVKGITTEQLELIRADLSRGESQNASGNAGAKKKKRKADAANDR